MDTSYKRTGTMSIGNINESGLFSERLKTLRGTANKAEFSRKIGLSAQTYQHYEDGRIPRSDILGIISERCGVTVDWLLGREDAHPGQASRPQNKPPPGLVREQADPCHYPGEIPAQISALAERLSAMEHNLTTISAQMETVTGLLSGALRAGLNKSEQKKAG